MRVLFVVALALLLPACAASVPMATAEADAQGKRFSPPPGQAALYVYREGWSGPAVNITVLADRHTLGELAPNTWLRVDRDPGRYDIRCGINRNTDSKIVQLAADEIHFVEIAFRFGLQCAVLESTPEKGRATVLAIRRAAGRADFSGAAVATPSGPILIIYRDDVSNQTRLHGVARYGGLLGRDGTVAFTVENELNQKYCDGTFTKDGPNSGKFTLQCAGGVSASGRYERMKGDPNDSLIARGQTSRGFPISLVVGRPAGNHGGA